VLAGAARLSLLAGAVPRPRRHARPRCRVHQLPGAGGLGDEAGEPTLGVNPKTGAMLYQSYTETLRVTDCKPNGSATWELGDFPTPAAGSFDPILRTDEDTGRTFTSQLLLACSQGGFTDDDAKSFTLSQGCGIGSAFDHQTVGFGPYVESSPLAALKNPVTNYPNVVYYCAQDVATAKCSMSTDGGITFPVTGVVYTTGECQLGGHLRPHQERARRHGLPAAAVLPRPDRRGVPDRRGRLRGQRPDWDVREVPGSVYGDAGHPSVGVGRNGDVYLPTAVAAARRTSRAAARR
jgi:hypothetical protein